jgi:hypothetical protein
MGQHWNLLGVRLDGRHNVVTNFLTLAHNFVFGAFHNGTRLGQIF